MIGRALILLLIASLSGSVLARGNGRKPCDRHAGGVVGCKAGKFICANGTVSGSKLVCK